MTGGGAGAAGIGLTGMMNSERTDHAVTERGIHGSGPVALCSSTAVSPSRASSAAPNTSRHTTPSGAGATNVDRQRLFAAETVPGRLARIGLMLAGSMSVTVADGSCVRTVTLISTASPLRTTLAVTAAGVVNGVAAAVKRKGCG